VIRLNHRGLFNRFLSRIGVLEKQVEILRTVDKLAKIGREETLRLLSETAGGDRAAQILGFIETKGSFDEVLGKLTKEACGNGGCPESERLSMIRRFIADTGTGDFSASGSFVLDSFVLDPSITRGLDYYTGIVYETFLKEMPEIGSICSGGRYDNLAALYSKEAIPGVGSSIGLDRLIAAMENSGRLRPRPGYARLAIACQKEDQGGVCQALAERFRRRGIACEVFLEEGKLTKQFMLAESKGEGWLIIPGDDPLNSPLTLRDLSKRENREGLSVEDIAAMVLGGA
jgi:histidyl-tRNA synthetase